MSARLNLIEIDAGPQKTPRSIKELWEASDAVTQQVLKKPYSHIFAYLKLLLFDGLPPKDTQK